MTAVEWAWLAGLFEGEGNIAFTGANSVTLSMGSTDRDVIERVALLTGVGTTRVDGARAAVGRKPLWSWMVHRRADVLLILDGIELHLAARRAARARAARERLANCRVEGYCIRGHEFAGENVYLTPTGARQCRACKRLRDEARRPRATV